MTSLHNLQIVQPGEKLTRKQRAPNFPAVGGLNPFGLYPAFFTPVLPGETLESYSWKSTIVSSPLKSPLAGAWYENWLFYVRITDIDPALGEMFIGQMTDPTPYLATVDRPIYFTKAGQVDWLHLATKKVMEHFFLDENETAVAYTDGAYRIKRIHSDVFESAMLKASVDAGTAGDPEGPDISEQMAAYLRMNQMGMGFTSYEDYLKTYGLREAEAPRAARAPELLAYRRHWTLPTNVIDPSNGAARGAWYWRIEDTADKPKRFLEPGFLIAFQAVRPKVLESNRRCSVASSLWGFQDFLPSYTLADPTAGLRKVDASAQPWITTTQTTAGTEIWFDHRDLLTEGEQFVNGAQRTALPATAARKWISGASTADLRGSYVPQADWANWFASATGVQNIEYDGIATVRIKGHVTNATG